MVIECQMQLNDGHYNSLSINGLIIF